MSLAALQPAELHVAPAQSCRACGRPLRRTFLDLGPMPLVNALLDSPDQPEDRYPLHVRLCEKCLLVQADPVVTPDVLFDRGYPYFSGFSSAWRQHCADYVKMATYRFRLGSKSHVLEIASNDGCLLQRFNHQINVLGVEPARNVAEVARENGVPTIVGFFGAQFAETLHQADLIVANNVLGHVPDLDDFVGGLKRALAPEGTITIEFPWLLNLIRECQFDTIYHEHYSYLSLTAVQTLLRRHGLLVYDVDRLPTHGGSLRLYVAHDDANPRLGWGIGPNPVLLEETLAGMADPAADIYRRFADRVNLRVQALQAFLAEQRWLGRTVAAAGASAKGAALLNAAGVEAEDILFVTDASPHKQHKFLPGSRIPILDREALDRYQPEFVIVLAWNWWDEITGELGRVRDWGGRFVRPIPALRVA